MVNERSTNGSYDARKRDLGWREVFFSTKSKNSTEEVMKVAESKNGETRLTVNKSELGFIQATIDKAAGDGFTAGLINHADVHAMAADIRDWLEYKRLDEKFRGRPEYEKRAGAVKAVLHKP